MKLPTDSKPCCRVPEHSAEEASSSCASELASGLVHVNLLYNITGSPWNKLDPAIMTYTVIMITV